MCGHQRAGAGTRSVARPCSPSRDDLATDTAKKDDRRGIRVSQTDRHVHDAVVAVASRSDRRCQDDRPRHQLAGPPGTNGRTGRCPARHPPEQRRAKPPQALMSDEPRLPAGPGTFDRKSGCQRGAANRDVVRAGCENPTSMAWARNMFSLWSTGRPSNHTSAIVASPPRRSSHGPSCSLGTSNVARHHQSCVEVERVVDVPASGGSQRGGRSSRHDRGQPLDVEQTQVFRSLRRAGSVEQSSQSVIVGDQRGHCGVPLALQCVE